jgi:hypothetical protein
LPTDVEFAEANKAEEAEFADDDEEPEESQQEREFPSSTTSPGVLCGSLLPLGVNATG